MHLLGHYSAARIAYDRAVTQLRASTDLRAISVFQRHKADLLRKLGDWKDAEKCLKQSIAAAESGRFPDLVQYTRIAETNLQLARGENVSVERLEPAIELANRIGVPKLECEAKGVQGRVALARGELELADRLSTASMGIASALGLKSRLTGGLILAGQVAAAKGNHAAAESLFRSALDLAERQRNQLFVERSERLLSESHELKPSGVGRQSSRLRTESAVSH